MKHIYSLITAVMGIDTIEHGMFPLPDDHGSDFVQLNVVVLITNLVWKFFHTNENHSPHDRFCQKI